MHIEGASSNLLVIHGQAGGLRGAEQTLSPDHIEAASLAAIATLTPGHVTIQPVIRADLHMISAVYEKLGVQLVVEGDQLHTYEQPWGSFLGAQHPNVDLAVDTAPWPGFPSDLVAVTTVMATQTNATTLIHEKLFSDRLLFVDKLRGMGAQIVLSDPHRAIVIGKTPLHGEYIDNPDVRIGLGLLAAALCAQGRTTIDRAELIGRYFEDVIPKLTALGAAIEVEP
ncbi:MAG: hypothetical protein HC915_06845 [Anaerolineae bacterium]|nr:hypothetical protein [Anaerolineae bacterium]